MSDDFSLECFNCREYDMRASSMAEMLRAIVAKDRTLGNPVLTPVEREVIDCAASILEAKSQGMSDHPGFKVS